MTEQQLMLIYYDGLVMAVPPDSITAKGIGLAEILYGRLSKQAIRILGKHNEWMDESQLKALVVLEEYVGRVA